MFQEFEKSCLFILYCNSQPRFVLNLLLLLSKVQPKCSYKIVHISKKKSVDVYNILTKVKVVYFRPFDVLSDGKCFYVLRPIM